MLKFVMIINRYIYKFRARLAMNLVWFGPYWKTFENLRAQSILYDVGKGQLEETRLSRGLYGQGRPQGS